MNDRLHVAATILGHLIAGSPGRDLRARLPDVRHSIDLADILIGQCETSTPSGSSLAADLYDSDDACPHAPPMDPRPNLPFLPELIYRRRRASLQQPDPTKPPTMH